MSSSVKKQIFAISGSLRPGSSNHHVLKFLNLAVPNDVGFTIYDNLANIPPFDPGNDNEYPPDSVTDLRRRIENADAIIICTPEYAYGVPGQLKNALDWMVSSRSINNKKVCQITASTGGQNAHAAMLLILGALNAHLISGATLLIPFIRSKMDNTGNINDAALADNLKCALYALLDAL